MSITFIAFLLAVAGLTAYFLTPAGRAAWKGARSNVLMLVGGILVTGNEIVMQLQDFPWSAYLEPTEALIASVTTIALGAVFSALKKSRS